MPQIRDVTYAVVRSARRSAAIYVERDGSVSVRVPEATTDDRVQKLVEKKLPWIYRNIAKWRELNGEPTQKEFVSGESFLFLGKPCILDIRAEAPEALSLQGDRFVLRANEVAHAEELLKAFYRKEGYERLPRLISQYATTIGAKPGKLRVWELKHRWASCSPAGNLNFHWRVMTAPLDVVEYLVVHELAHLKERGHTPRFWAEVERAMPRWKAGAEWLRLNGAAMVF